MLTLEQLRAPSDEEAARFDLAEVDLTLATVGRFHTHPPKYDFGSDLFCSLSKEPSKADNKNVLNNPRRGLIITAPYLPSPFSPPLLPTRWSPHPYGPIKYRDGLPEEREGPR